MRLICPNCGAQYEVAADAIPEGGRDVQCSNCGHTWFETPGASASEEGETVSSENFSETQVVEAADLDTPIEPDFYEDEEDVLDKIPDRAKVVDTVSETVEDPLSEMLGKADDAGADLGDMISTQAEAASDAAEALKSGAEEALSSDAVQEVQSKASDMLESGADAAQAAKSKASDMLDSGAAAMDELTSDAADTLKDASAGAQDIAAKAATAAEAPASRHKLQDSVADILREEAAREQTARKADAPLETQTDMPVEPAQADREASSSRIARLKGDTAAQATAAGAGLAAAASSRKEALPNIDEISSTLRSNAERGERFAPAPEEVEKTKKTGFRWGFWGILLLILLAVLIYLFSDQIIAALPAAEGPVSAYASAVDGLRGSITGMAESAVDSLESETAAADQ